MPYGPQRSNCARSIHSIVSFWELVKSRRSSPMVVSRSSIPNDRVIWGFECTSSHRNRVPITKQIFHLTLCYVLACYCGLHIRILDHWETWTLSTEATRVRVLAETYSALITVSIEINCTFGWSCNDARLRNSETLFLNFHVKNSKLDQI